MGHFKYGPLKKWALRNSVILENGSHRKNGHFKIGHFEMGHFEIEQLLNNWHFEDCLLRKRSPKMDHYVK